MVLKTHGRVSLQVYLPMVGVFTDQVNTNYIVGAALLKHQQWQRDCFVPRNDGSTINKCLTYGERGTDNKPGRASGLVGG